MNTSIEILVWKLKVRLEVSRRKKNCPIWRYAKPHFISASMTNFFFLTIFAPTWSLMQKSVAQIYPKMVGTY